MTLRPRRTRSRTARTRNRRIMVCFGTRPEIIKLAPVIEMLQRSDGFEAITVTTAQHREMLDQMLITFGITPDVDLGLMAPGQSLADLTGKAVAQLAAAMETHRPDAVLVQGDTTTAFCAALAAYYADIPVGHVEAGLRTFDPRSPFPEEINRKMIGSLAEWHFCPTDQTHRNLLAEGIDPDAMTITGNTVVDALLSMLARPDTAVTAAKRRAKRILVTMHRRETQGDQQRDLCRMLARVARREDVEIVFPVHLSPAVRTSVMAELDGIENVHLVEPMEYASFVQLMASSDLIVSDSGGLQEEAPTLDIPLLVMRDTTERWEGIEAGCVRLSGTDPLQIEEHIHELLDDANAYRAMAEVANPYGDGTSSRQIVDFLRTALAEGRGKRSLRRQMYANVQLARTTAMPVGDDQIEFTKVSRA